MRKTQNFLRRAGSAALALTLTVSLCQPAFAATKAPFSKDETVYAVMAADGSVIPSFGIPTTPMFTTRATRTVSCPSLPK